MMRARRSLMMDSRREYAHHRAGDALNLEAVAVVARDPLQAEPGFDPQFAAAFGGGVGLGGQQRSVQVGGLAAITRRPA